MTVHITATPCQTRGMSRYEFTDAATGFRVATVEAQTAESAREIAVRRTGFTGPMRCSHLSDYHAPSEYAGWTLPDYETFMEESGARG